MIKKYFHPPYVTEFNTPDDWPVFPYSGALLLLSECLVQEGKSRHILNNIVSFGLIYYFRIII